MIYEFLYPLDDILFPIFACFVKRNFDALYINMAYQVSPSVTYRVYRISGI